MTNPIDLSKYAKGRRLKCIRGSGSQLTEGREYESRGTHEEGAYVELINDDGIVQDGWDKSRFVPVEDEAPSSSEFRPGDKVRHTVTRWLGTVVRVRAGANPSALVDWSGHGQIDAFLSNLELVDAAASPVEKPPLGSPPYDNPRIYTPDRQVREWDADKYNGLDAPTYQQLSTLDKRIAVARAELDLGTADRMKRMAGPRFPPEGRSDRVTQYRRWGQS